MNNVSCPTDDMLIIACNGCGFGAISWQNRYFFNHIFKGNAMIGDSYAIPIYSQDYSPTNDIKCNATLTSKSAYSRVSILTCTTFVRSWNLLYHTNIFRCLGYSQPSMQFMGFYGYAAGLFTLTQPILLSANCLTGKW